MSKKLKEMIDLRKQGLSYREIGRRFGISKQAVFKQVKGVEVDEEVDASQSNRKILERLDKLERKAEVLYLYMDKILKLLEMKYIVLCGDRRKFKEEFEKK